MTTAEKNMEIRGESRSRLSKLAACRVLALLSLLSGMVVALMGLLLVSGAITEVKHPVEGGVVLTFGLFWAALGTALLKAPRLMLMSLAAFFSLVALLFFLLLGSGFIASGEGRWGVVVWALVVNIVATTAFYKGVMVGRLREGSLPKPLPLKLLHITGASQFFCLRNTSAIAWRETKRYFRSPSSYIILALFLLYQGLVFYIAVRYLNDPRAPHGAPMKFFFGGPFWFWPLECFIIAIITMDTLADEQIRGTVEPMMTAPVSEIELVIGKFLGAFGFFVFLWVWTFLYVLLMVAHTEGVAHSTIVEWGLISGFAGMWTVMYVSTRKGGSSGVISLLMMAASGLLAVRMSSIEFGAFVKNLGLCFVPVGAIVLRERVPAAMSSAKNALWAIFLAGALLLAVMDVWLMVRLFHEAGRNAPKIGPILSGYLGALLIGAAGIALGILYSSLTRDLKLACMLTFVSLFLLIIVKIMLLPELNLIETEWVRKFLEHINFFDYMADFSRGIVDTRQLTLLGTIIIACLFGASRAVQSFKWR